ATQNRLLQLKAQDDVQVVGRLVRLDADKRRLHVVNREEEIVQGNVVKRFVKDLTGAGEEMLPEGTTAASLVLPQARLRFVDAQRGEAAQRRAVVSGIEALLVDGVAGLVQDAEKRLVEETRVVARGDAAVAGADAAAKGMRRHVQPAGREVEANRRRGRFAEYPLAVNGVIAFEDVPAWPPTARLDGGNTGDLILTRSGEH